VRPIVWFSCGAASAVAAKLAVNKYGDKLEVIYCDTLAYEHPDNKRFMNNVSSWIGMEIKIIRSEKYTDIYDVFRKTKYLVGVGGARCTTELKKIPRKKYQKPDDIHIFGFTVDEQKRIDRFKEQNFEKTDFILAENGVTKNDCYRILQESGIELPMMYKLGFNNNNCIGCVKAGAGYWNKVRKLFPDVYEKMARLERELDVAINKKYVDGKRVRVFLDELDPNQGRLEQELDIECGVICNEKEA
jgi:3'-phosphoadenosine 5'-phosphosulfate sulfotransferase (PAPS reductase)/FAD synthetase